MSERKKSDYYMYKTRQKSMHPFIINRDNLNHSNFTPPLPPEAVMHPEEFAANLTKRLLKAQKGMKDKEMNGDKVQEKFESVEVNGSLESRENFLYVAEEDQAILDQHICFVFPETTPTFSHNCSTLLASSEGSEDSACVVLAARCISESNLSHDLSCDGSLKVVPSVFSEPFTKRIGRDPGTCSDDSSSVRNVCTSEDNSEFDRATYGSQVLHIREKLKGIELSYFTGSVSNCIDSDASTACESVQPVRAKSTVPKKKRKGKKDQTNLRKGLLKKVHNTRAPKIKYSKQVMYIKVSAQPTKDVPESLKSVRETAVLCKEKAIEIPWNIASTSQGVLIAGNFPTFTNVKTAGQCRIYEVYFHSIFKVWMSLSKCMLEYSERLRSLKKAFCLLPKDSESHEMLKKEYHKEKESYNENIVHAQFRVVQRQLVLVLILITKFDNSFCSQFLDNFKTLLKKKSYLLKYFA